MNTTHPRCLVAEDQALIALALEAYLEDVGMEIAGPFASCEQALAWVKDDTPDLALLDYRLRDGVCTELVRTLTRRGVPVVIYSGIPQGIDTPSDLRDVPWIEKPVDRARLLEVLFHAAKAAPAIQLA
jgi:DNA-binding NtrC family response regulator